MSVVLSGADPALIQYTYTLTSANQPMRWEFRVHTFGGSWFPTHSGGANWLISAGQTVNGDNHIGTNVLYWGQGEGVGYNSQTITGLGDHIPPAGSGDMVIRIQRDPLGTYCSGSACYVIEACWTLGGTCKYQTWTGIAMQAKGTDLNFIVIPPIASESASPTYAVAFYRVFPTLVQPGLHGTGLVNPIAVHPPANPSSLIGDWEFEGNLKDSSGHAGSFSTIGGVQVSYISTPIYPPACAAGSPQTYRAGFPITLDGSASAPLDEGSTLTYQWQLATEGDTARPHAGTAQSPFTVAWKGLTDIAKPSATIAQAGSYDFQLTLTDGSGQSSSCMVHDGAVAADNDGVVIYPPGPLYSAAKQFLGPLVQWGKNPWSWYDTTHKLAADANLTVFGPPLGNGIPVTSLTDPVGLSDAVLAVGSSSSCTPGAGIVVDSEQILLGNSIDATHCAIWLRGYRGSTAAAHASGATVSVFYYWDWWNWAEGPGSGTCAVTGGSFILTCTGAQFETGGNYAVCDATGKANGNNIVIWHPTDSAITGRTVVYIGSCSSDTVLTMSSAGGLNGTWNSTYPPGGNLHYSIATSTELYWYDPAAGDPRTMNYYDNVVGYYLLYLRSGMDTYLTAARTLADYWYFGPYIDQGYGVEQYPWGSLGTSSRAASALGMWLRSLDFPQVDMLPGLERFTTWPMYDLARNGDGNKGVGDQRERGYEVSEIAELATLDTNPALNNLTAYVPNQSNNTWSQAALYLLANLVNPSSTTGWNVWPYTQDSAGLWEENEASSSWCSCSSGNSNNTPNQSVSLTNGSATVIGANTAWNSSLVGLPIWFWHPATLSTLTANITASSNVLSVASSAWNVGTYGVVQIGSEQLQLNGNIDSTHIGIRLRGFNGTTAAAAAAGASVLQVPATFPSSNTRGDATAFYVASVQSGAQLTLTANYSYSTCPSCGYQVSTDDDFNGWGGYGYMFAILTNGMEWDAQALAATDPADSAMARTLAANANGWLLNYARRTDTNGLNYGAGFANCPYPVPQNDTICSTAGSVAQSLGNSATGLIPWATMYLYNQDPASKIAADAMYNQMWAKPGTCSGPPCDDSVTTSCALPPCYLNQWEPSVDGFLNGFGTGIPQPKWFGQFFGFGNFSSWPAVRLNLGQPETNQAIYIDPNLKSVPGATRVRIKATFPNRDTREADCSTAPCVIGIDPRQGAYDLDLTYISMDGSVLSTTSTHRTVPF